MIVRKKRSEQSSESKNKEVKMSKVKSILEPEIQNRKKVGFSFLLDYARFKTQNNLLKKEGMLYSKYGMYKANDKMMSYYVSNTSKNNRNFTYRIEYGNNSNLIRRLMEGRSNWAQNNQNPNFIWKPTSYGMRFSNSSNYLKKKMFNHIEHHEELTDKGKLFLNVTHYCNKHQSISAESIFPNTFVFEYNKNNSIEKLHQFIKLFELIKNNTNLKNIWIYKPSDLNRGRGIALVDSLFELKKILLKEDNTKKKWFLFNNDMDRNEIVADLEKIILTSKNKETRSFILQKYIENPLLLHDRKFDIRMWVLVDHEKRYYVFKEGYVRMSSQIYQLTSKSLANKFIHLTNNAIQKFSEKYGKQEDGNQLSFEALKNFLELKHKIDFNHQIIEPIKEIIKLSMKSVKSKLLGRYYHTNIVGGENINMKNMKNKKMQKYQLYYSSSSSTTQNIQQTAYFEIFGYDFLLDRSFNVYLLEVNTNPCLEESSKLLEALVPRMVNDAFKLTIDKLFQTKKESIQLLQILNYPDSYNMWQYLGSINQCPPNQQNIQ